MTDRYEAAIEALKDLAAPAATEVKVRRRDMARLRRQSLQLDQFLHGDFSSLDAEFRRVFPKAAPHMPRRVYPLVKRVSQELATLYLRAPLRRFLGANEAQWTKLQEVYRASGVDRVLLEAHRQLIPQQTQVLLVLPAGPRRVQVYALSPYQVWVAPGNALAARDIQQAAAVRLRLPVAATDDSVALSDMVLTPDQCYWEVGGERSSVFNPRDPTDLSNPWPGYLPLVAIHAAKPPEGWFLSSLADDLLAEQIGMCLAISWLEHQSRHSYAQRVIEPSEGGGVTQEMADQMPVGADRWVALPGPGSKLNVVQPQPPLGEGRQIIDWQLAMTASFHDLSPDAFSKSPAAKTAVSRAYDRADREEHRASFGEVFAPAETQLAQLVARVLNLSGAAIPVPEDLSVVVEYLDTEDTPADPVHAAQARTMDFRQGLDNPIDYLVRKYRVSRTEAERVWRANIEIAKQLPGQDVPPPGAA